MRDLKDLYDAISNLQDAALHVVQGDATGVNVGHISDIITKASILRLDAGHHLSQAAYKHACAKVDAKIASGEAYGNQKARLLALPGAKTTVADVEAAVERDKRYGEVRLQEAQAESDKIRLANIYESLRDIQDALKWKAKVIMSGEQESNYVP